MAITTRQGLKDYALRALGHPVIEINVEDSQVEDRIDEALQFFTDKDDLGSHKVYYKYLITASDITNEYISTDDIDTHLSSITRIFPVGIGGNGSSVDFFSIPYQMALSDFYGTRTGMINLTHYTSTMQHMEMVQQLLVPEKQVRFNKLHNRLYIDAKWSEFSTIRYLMIEGYSVLDPEESNEIYGDAWLKHYTKALIKRQWGANLSKYSGIQMPGAVTFNGEKLYTEAIEEIAKLEEDSRLSRQSPPEFFTG
jgi:hypothetical protein